MVAVEIGVGNGRGGGRQSARTTTRRRRRSWGTLPVAAIRRVRWSDQEVAMKTWLRQNRGFLLFVVGFAFFRSAMADWNTIPSGSMRPTLLEGDVVLVD